jgi:transcriptional regulator with XRE-family HTH domain
VKDVSERVRWILSSRNLSDRALAKAAGVSHNYIGLLRRGQRGERGLSPETARKIAVAAGVDPHWMLTGEGSPSVGLDPAADSHPARQQALALLEGRIDGPVKSALLAERPAEEQWPVDRWIDRARELQTLYEKVVRDFDETDENNS